jgi:hypothetical protein
MPKVNYQNGIIYRIKNKYTDECYVGSSTYTINRRFSKHKSKYKKYELHDKWISSYYLFLKYGVENCYIELIKNFPCSSKKELEHEEGIITKQELNRVNLNIAGRTRREYRQDNADKIKASKQKWREDNADKVKASNQKYREDNADKNMSEYYKKWRADNAERVKAYKQEYRQRKKQKTKTALQSM